MRKPLRPEIIQRLVLAKLLFKQGEALCSIPNDKLRFAIGLLSFHDAVENALGAAADNLGAQIPKKKIYLMDYYDLIQQADTDTKKPILPYQIQMERLNTIRNSIKHQGIFPDVKTEKHYPIIVRELLMTICKTYFDLDFDVLSLKDSIRDERIKTLVEQVEIDIESSRYREALETMSQIMFKVFESNILGSQEFVEFLLSERRGGEHSPQPDIMFPEFDQVRHTIKLLEKGIEPVLYHRFKNLTPQVGRERATIKLVFEWEKEFGHHLNWTEENVRFCYDFMIDAILKLQGEEYRGYKLIPYSQVFVDYIEPVVEEAIFWNRVESYTNGYFGRESLEPPKEIFRLKRGERIVGYSDIHKGNRQYLFVISEDIPIFPDSEIRFGYVKKDEVKVTPVPKDEIQSKSDVDINGDEVNYRDGTKEKSD